MDLTQELGPGVKRVLGLIVALVFFMPGFWVMLAGLGNLYYGVASESWPSVRGEIIQSVTTSSRPGPAHRSQRVYGADVVTRFSYKGENYRSERVSFGDYSSSSGDYARWVSRRFPQGKEAAVYFDPDNPTNNVLIPGVHPRTFFKPLFGLAFVIAGLVIAYFVERGYRKQCEGVHSGEA